MKTKVTQMVMGTQRSDWEVYHDMSEIVVNMPSNQLLTLAREAMSAPVAMAASDELARRRPGKR